MNTLNTLHPVPAERLRRSDLLPYVPTYCQRLSEQGYAPSTCRTYLLCVAHFAGWLTERERPLVQLCSDDVIRFLDEHLAQCACSFPVRRVRNDCRAALRHLMIALRDAGVLAEETQHTANERELRRYDAFMDHDQGLAFNTRRQRVGIIRTFLQQNPGSGADKLPPVTAAHLRAFIQKTLRRWSPASARILVGTLRRVNTM